VVLGVVGGGVVALVLSLVLIISQVIGMAKPVNGWLGQRTCGLETNNFVVRAACDYWLPAVNSPQEAVYWTMGQPNGGVSLSSAHNYVLHFAAGQLPPVDGFWSITMTNIRETMVANSINRYSIGDRSNLTANADGSVDIYIQESEPTGHESNWLPAPSGGFILWLRAYQPQQAILDGTWTPPAIQEVS